MDPFVHINHNDGHHHHGQDVQAVLGEGPAPSPGGGLGATPPLHLLQTLGGAVFCLF